MKTRENFRAYSKVNPYDPSDCAGEYFGSAQASREIRACPTSAAA